jgi:hypothetical protein
MGNLETVFGKKGSGPEEFQQILGISISEKNEVLVYDESLNKIKIFSGKGRFVKSANGVKDLNLFEASNFILYHHDSVYVPTIDMKFRNEPWNTHLITKFDVDKNNLHYIGKYSKEIESAKNTDYSPIYTYDTQEKTFYVTYNSVPVIQKFSLNGDLISEIYNPSINIRKPARRLEASTSRSETLKQLNLVSTPRNLFITEDYLILYFFNKNESGPDSLYISVFDKLTFEYLGDSAVPSPVKFVDRYSNLIFLEKAINSDPYMLYAYEIRHIP